MSNAEDILNQTLIGNYHVNDNAIVVDYDTRSINIPKSIKYLGVESDDNVMSLDFVIPRHFNDIDLSDFTVNINYLNAKNEGDVYTVDNVTVDDDVITFSWTVGRYALALAGNVCFNVCLKKFDDTDPSIVVQEFNTTIATLPVLKGLETSEAVIQEYADILVKWRTELFGIGSSFEAELRDTTNVLKVELAYAADDQTMLSKNAINKHCEDACSTVDARVESSINDILNWYPTAVMTEEEYNALMDALE